jgi:hypothetical protein
VACDPVVLLMIVRREVQAIMEISGKPKEPTFKKY